MMIRGWVALCAAIALGACSENTALDPAAPSRGDADNKRAVILNIDAPLDDARDVAFGDQIQIVVSARFADDGSPAVEQQITFELAETVQGAGLAAQTRYVDREGKVFNTLSVGSDLGNIHVVVKHPRADSVDFVIHVTGKPKGSLRVMFDYQGVITLQNLETRLYRDLAACSAAPTQIPVATMRAESVNRTLTFAGLTEDARYAVLVEARGPLGNLVARGCVQSQPIIARTTITAVVPLSLLPPVLVGDYDFSQQLLAYEGLPEPADEIFGQISDFFISPGDLIVDLILDEILPSSGLERLLAETAINSAANMAYGNTPGADFDHNGRVSFGEAFSYQFFRISPPWLDEGFNLGGDVTAILADMTVGGKLHIDGLTSEGGVRGHYTYDDYLFRWRLLEGCDPRDQCCGRSQYSGEEIGLAPFIAQFTGKAKVHESFQYLAFDVTIDTHRVGLNYGNIIYFVARELVFPTLAGTHDMGRAIESLFGCNSHGQCGCAAVGAFLDNSFLGSLGGRTGSAICRAVVTTASTRLGRMFDQLIFYGSDDAHLDATLGGVFIDSDKDLSIDNFTGNAQGRIVLGAHDKAFRGTWTGWREMKSCHSNFDCEGARVCRVMPNVLNDCTGHTVCNKPEGDRAAGALCQANAECISGTCLPNGLCLGVCEETNQCSEGLVCGEPVHVPLQGRSSFEVKSCVAGSQPL